MSELPNPDATARETEATGETVGEAKWAALRELERRFPGLDKSQVELVVVSEGERGLLGVGFVPAKVLARVVGPLPAAAAGPAVEAMDEADRASLTPDAVRLHDLLELVRAALALDASISIDESEQRLAGAYRGHDLGLVIGKHGQTIDAVQHLASAIVLHGSAGDRRDVVVDAAGYRDRRRATLEALADRAAARVVASGVEAKLEPMSAPERKIVHLRLQERSDVTTASDGQEPERYVVIQPAS
jgi:spoIIIJ-associated protein